MNRAPPMTVEMPARMQRFSPAWMPKRSSTWTLKRDVCRGTPKLQSDRWLQRVPYRNHGLGASSHIHGGGMTLLGLVSELSNTLQDEERTVRLVAR